jgi:hypothetical protein
MTAQLVDGGGRSARPAARSRPSSAGPNRRPSPAPAIGILSAAAAGEGVARRPGNGNLARLLKKPELKALLPLGLVARAERGAAFNVLAQEASIDLSAQVWCSPQWPPYWEVVGARWIRHRRPSTASVRAVRLQAGSSTGGQGSRPGSPDTTLKALDELMAKPPGERWHFLARAIGPVHQVLRLPRIVSDVQVRRSAFMDKNQPQWFPECRRPSRQFFVASAARVSSGRAGVSAAAPVTRRAQPASGMESAQRGDGPIDLEAFWPSRRGRSEGRAAAVRLTERATRRILFCETDARDTLTSGRRRCNKPACASWRR